jgi:membrane protein CcdC involved in cytochrome C biogenesis
MSVISLLFMGFLTAVALLVICYRIGIKKIVGYPVFADLGASIMFCLLLAGTLTGMTIAIIAGLCFSFAIWCIRRLTGYERFDIKQRVWIYYPPQHA